MTPLYRWLSARLPRALVAPLWVTLVALALATIVISVGSGSPNIVYLDVGAQ